MIGYLISLAVGVLFLIIYIREKIRGASPLALLLKTLVSVCFMAAAFSAFLSVTDRTDKMLPAILILAGLFFGLLGDIFLDLKLVYPASDRIYTFTGFGVFAVGHVCFMAAMLISFGEGLTLPCLILPFAVGILAGVGNVIFLEKPMKLSYGIYRIITMVYGSILFSAVLLSLSLSLTGALSRTYQNIFSIGLILFLISDLVLSGSYFGKGHDRPIDTILNYIFYYGAQFLIASVVLFL